MFTKCVFANRIHFYGISDYIEDSKYLVTQYMRMFLNMGVHILERFSLRWHAAVRSQRKDVLGKFTYILLSRK